MMATPTEQLMQTEFFRKIVDDHMRTITPDSFSGIFTGAHTMDNTFKIFMSGRQAGKTWAQAQTTMMQQAPPGFRSGPLIDGKTGELIDEVAELARRAQYARK